MEAGLEGVHYYDPPNMTFPFGSYVVVVDVDKDTGQWTVRRMVAVDDCGVRINPMIVDGQIHGGLAEGYAMSSMQFITFDDDGNCIGSNFMDYLIPTAWETPRFELAATVTPVTPPPDRCQGCRRVCHRRLSRGVCQRGHRRARPPGHPQHRHAGPAGSGVVGVTGR